VKIAFLVFNLNGMGGTSRSVITQANALAGDHEILLVSVTRSSESTHYHLDPRIKVDYLVDTVPGEPPAAVSGIVDPETALRLHERESLLVPARWDRLFTALTDVAMEGHLPTVEADVLVTVTPGLLAAAIQLLPPTVAVLHQEHRSSSDRTTTLEPLLAFAPRADAVVLLTDSMAMWLEEQLGPGVTTTLVMPNPLPQKHAPRSRLDTGIIVAAGRVVREKQFDKLIEAFAAIADQIPEWRLRVLGEGPSRAGLKRLARKHELWDRVELPGSTTDMLGEWAKASICALTSKAEGFPLVAQEAMAAGVPVASFDCAAGPREIVEHEVNGLLVVPDSVPGMASALLRLATDDELRSKLGEGAFVSSERYAPDVLATQWTEIFETVVNRRRGNGEGRLLRRLVRQAGAVRPDERHNPAPGDLTPAMARAAALEWAVGIARRVSSSWFVIPPHESRPSTVVVPMPDRDSFLRELERGDGPTYLSAVDPGGFGWPERRARPEDLARDLRRGRTPAIGLEPWPVAGEKPGILAHGCRVDVEFWEVAVDGDLVATRNNPFTARVSAGSSMVETEIEGVTARTVPLMTAPLVRECRFPIDVVYTWADGSDPAWNDQHEERLADLTGAARRNKWTGERRFAARDDLRYSMRSVHLFAPWVRRIHLVTAGQGPDWLDLSHPRISLVDHAEILPADVLPTFNSHAIETGLHRVPDLTEHWIYLTDDVFLGRAVRPERFFTPAGQPCVFPSQNSLAMTDEPNTAPGCHGGLNDRGLLESAFGVITGAVAHAPHPHRVSVLEEITQRFPDELAATARSPFSTATDLSLLSSLAQNYGLITGSAVVGAPGEASCVDLAAADVNRQFNRLLEREQDFFSIDDHHVHGLKPGAPSDRLSRFLESYLPIAAPWEKQ
jgi:glycosyltransferase involved in cell wall biosynthesis